MYRIVTRVNGEKEVLAYYTTYQQAVGRIRMWEEKLQKHGYIAWIEVCVTNDEWVMM